MDFGKVRIRTGLTRTHDLIKKKNQGIEIYPLIRSGFVKNTIKVVNPIGENDNDDDASSFHCSFS